MRSLSSKIEIWIYLIGCIIIQISILIIKLNSRLLPISRIATKRLNCRFLYFLIWKIVRDIIHHILRWSQMSIYLKHILAWKQTHNFAVFNDIILFFELVVLFSSFEIFPTYDGQALLAVDILDGVVTTYKVFLHTIAFYYIYNICSKKSLSWLALIIRPYYIEIHIAKHILTSFTYTFSFRFYI